MDFIEKIFRVSPDGGSGVTELFYLIAVSGVVFGIVFRRRLVRFIQRAMRVEPVK